MVFAGHNAMSQNLKFGHINSDELIQALPEFDSASVKLNKFQKELVNALEMMQVELNTKNEAYVKDSKNLSDIVRQTKEQELSDMGRRIQEFQTSAQTQLQDKQAELFQPIVLKVNKTIADLFMFSISDREPLFFISMRQEVQTLCRLPKQNSD
jgi:outer membrane protein